MTSVGIDGLRVNSFQTNGIFLPIKTGWSILNIDMRTDKRRICRCVSVYFTQSSIQKPNSLNNCSVSGMQHMYVFQVQDTKLDSPLKCIVQY